MEKNSLLKNKLGIFIFLLFIIFLSVIKDSIAQQFPIGTYWVKRDRSYEGYNYYGQVAACGINIIVGGQYRSSTLPNILAAAEAENITMILDGITHTHDDSIQWYAGSDYQRHDRGVYHLPYESNGYAPILELQTIEAKVTYDF